MTQPILVDIGTAVMNMNVQYHITLNHKPHVYTDSIKNLRYSVKLSMYTSAYNKFTELNLISILDLCKLIESDIPRLFTSRQVHFSAYLPKQCIMMCRIEYEDNLMHII